MKAKISCEVFSIIFLYLITSYFSHFCSCNTSSLSGNGVISVAEYTLQYTIRVECSGRYYPGKTSIRVELFDIPLQTASQKVQAILQHGKMENSEGREVWVIETTDIYTMNVFTGTFIVRVSIATPPVPDQTLPVSGMNEYLSSDKYVTLNSEVVRQAGQLTSGVKSIPEAVARFVEWIQKNIAYDVKVGGGTQLTDAQVLHLRAGVCDEFSTLFIAFCRATGIPARRVLGYGLNVTDPRKLLNNDISGHAHSWAEVWIPDYGWLTVDPTWSDIGDARRIVTDREYEYSIKYQWKNAPPGFEITNIDYSITLIDCKVIDYVNTPVKLSKEELEDVWRVNIENNSTLPLLYNITVKKWSEEVNRWQPYSSQIIFLNPNTYCFLDLSKEENYWVYSVLGGVSLTLRVYSVSISGSVFTVDGKEYRGSMTFRWSEGSSHNISVPQVLEESEGKRHVFQRWSDGESSPSRTITVIGPGSYSAYFKTQYFLKVESEHGVALGSGWYDENTIASVKLYNLEEPAEFPYVYVFKGWAGDAYGESSEMQVVMNSPKVLVARWEKTFSKEFYIILAVIVTITILTPLTLLLRRRTKPQYLQPYD